MKYLWIVAFCFVSVYGHRLCKFDSDCSDLGSLVCIKSACDHGICGCARGTAARFYGSEMLFQCPPLKKIGETCSIDGRGTMGVCGPMNSYCDDTTKTCKCDDNYESAWGGELCSPMYSPKQGPSDTCSSAWDSTCQLDIGNTVECTQTFSGYGSSMAHLHDTCGCPMGYRTNLPNRYEDNYGFLGKKVPTCQPILHGEMCLVDGDCPMGMVCTDDLCACDNTTHVPNAEKTMCGWGYGKGVDCSGGEMCDGTLGLVCVPGFTGFCDINPNMTVAFCQCSPSHTDAGATCTEKGVGSSCFGDLNCKAFSKNGICADGLCKDGASMLSLSLAALVLSLATLLHNNAL